MDAFKLCSQDCKPAGCSKAWYLDIQLDNCFMPCRPQVDAHGDSKHQGFLF
jgi:hypothetical protein